MSAHTTTPWSVGLNGVVEGPDEEGKQFYVAQMCGSMTNPSIAADAAFIVRACNSHDALVTALRALIRATDGYDEDDLPPDLFARVVANAKKVLALAEAS